MRLATTTGDFGKFFECDKARVQAVTEAGFRYLDLSLYQGDRPNWKYMEPDWLDKILELKYYTESLGAKFIQCHAPGSFLGPMEGEEEVQKLVDCTIRSIEICGVLGIPNMVYHTGCRSDVKYNAEDEKYYFKVNKEVITRMFDALEKNNVNLLVENSTKANARDQYFFFTGDEMKRFIQYTDHPLVHGCWDTGHGNIEGNQYQSLLDLGDDLRALHIHDNRHNKDEHLMPYMGNINMDEIMCALRDMNYKGDFTFECDSSFPSNASRKPFAMDNRLAELPLWLFKDYEALVYKLGKYFLEAYDCFEE